MQDAFCKSTPARTNANDNLIAIAFDIVKTRRDDDIVDVLQLALGYTQLAEEYPWNDTYRRKADEMMESMRLLVKTKYVSAA